MGRSLAHSIAQLVDTGKLALLDRLVPAGDTFDLFDLAISPNYAVDHTLFASGYSAVRRSDDGGVTWTALHISFV